MGIFKRGTIEPKVKAPSPAEVSVAPKKKVALAILIGHQDTAQGASSVAPLSMSEYKFHKTVIAPLMQAEAAKYGIETRIFLRDNSSIGAVGAAASLWAKRFDKACSIELHFNSANGHASGTEVLYDTNEPDNAAFAKLVQAKICHALSRAGKTDRGAKVTDHGRGSHNLTSVKFTGCLVEPFFGDVKSECELILANKERYAVAIIGACRDYLLA